MGKGDLRDGSAHTATQPGKHAVPAVPSFSVCLPAPAYTMFHVQELAVVYTQKESYWKNIRQWSFPVGVCLGKEGIFYFLFFAVSRSLSLVVYDMIKCCFCRPCIVEGPALGLFLCWVLTPRRPWCLGLRLRDKVRCVQRLRINSQPLLWNGRALIVSGMAREGELGGWVCCLLCGMWSFQSYQLYLKSVDFRKGKHLKQGFIWLVFHYKEHICRFFCCCFKTWYSKPSVTLQRLKWRDWLATKWTDLISVFLSWATRSN